MGNNEPGYSKHVFVCGHERPDNSARGCCFEKGSLELLKLLKSKSKQIGLENVRVQKSGCLDYCEHGPTCVVYPEGVWFKLDDSSIESIANYLKDGIIPDDCLLDITT